LYLVFCMVHLSGVGCLEWDGMGFVFAHVISTLMGRSSGVGIAYVKAWDGPEGKGVSEGNIDILNSTQPLFVDAIVRDCYLYRHVLHYPRGVEAEYGGASRL
jgi:hypothetical protein